MLVLGRKPREAIIIRTPSGDIIRVTVVEIFDRNVRVGVQAAHEIEVHREEIYNAKYPPPQEP